MIVVDHCFMRLFGIDFDVRLRGEKLSGGLGVKTKGSLFKDFLIPDTICTLKNHVYKVCCFCYALLKSARIFPVEAIVEKLSMVKQFACVADGGVEGEERQPKSLHPFCITLNNGQG